MALLAGATQPLEPEHLALAYLIAKERVIHAGFADEIDWQQQVSLEAIDEHTFLRESAWVILCTGFRESILRRRFSAISHAFLGWRSADLIVSHRQKCRRSAMEVFRNERKIDAILAGAERVALLGFDRVREKIESHGVEFLQEFPFIGPVTACHLAKNIGVSIVKPDRHLVRVALKAGYDSPAQMCQAISEVVGDPLAVIDIVIWRTATLTEASFPEENISTRQDESAYSSLFCQTNLQ